MQNNHICSLYVQQEKLVLGVNKVVGIVSEVTFYGNYRLDYDNWLQWRYFMLPYTTWLPYTT